MPSPSSSVAANSIADLLSISQLPSSSSSSNISIFVANHPPQAMGNSNARIAFGGCTLGIAAAAACATVPDHFRAYSFLGHFTGPANVERPLRADVRPLRDTRTFRTRHVLVFQEQAASGRGAQERLVLSMLADFQAPEPTTVIPFSAAPRGPGPPPFSISWGAPKDAKSTQELGRELVAAGRLSEPVLRRLTTSFGLAARYFETRHAPGSVAGERLCGALKNAPISQDDGRPLPELVSADWIRVPHPLKPAHGAHISALILMLDMAVSLLPLYHDGKFLDDVGACSSLDFALRLFSNEIDLNQWKLREMMALAGAEGRTFSEARLFDTEGKMVAVMNQQCILRPKQAVLKL